MDVSNYLRSFFGRAGFTLSELDTVHWSLASNAEDAKLFIHWIGAEGSYYMKQYMAAGLRGTMLKGTKNKDMVDRRKRLRNILDYVQGDRLRNIKAALAAIQDKQKHEAATVAEASQDTQTRTPAKTACYQQTTPRSCTPTPTSHAGSPDRKRTKLDNER